jgi:hypothetical protein
MKRREKTRQVTTAQVQNPAAVNPECLRDLNRQEESDRYGLRREDYRCLAITAKLMLSPISLKLGNY